MLFYDWLICLYIVVLLVIEGMIMYSYITVRLFIEVRHFKYLLYSNIVQFHPEELH